jgi:hypothetical protein
MEGFCPTGKSRLFDIHATNLEIRIGSLDEAPTRLAVPRLEGWIKRRERWLQPVIGAKQNIEDRRLSLFHETRCNLAVLVS